MELQLENITKSYKGKDVLKGISLPWGRESTDCWVPTGRGKPL